MLRSAVFTYTFLMLAICYTSSAQIIWQDNLEKAINLAKMSNRPVFIDFWATWCGPCKKMDAEVWSTGDINLVKNKFVFAKIDIDYNRADALAYNVRAIPAMVIIDIEQNKYIEIKGYQELEYMIDLMQAFPDDMTQIYEKMNQVNQEESFNGHMEIAGGLQKYASQISNSMVRNGFLDASSAHLRRAGKLVKDEPEELERVEIMELINLSYQNESKAIKKLDKLREESTGANEALFDYAYCKCYAMGGDLKTAREYYSKVVDSGRDDLTAQLSDQFKEN